MPKAPPKVGRAPKRKAWRTSTKGSTERGYGWDHQKARARLLRAEPLCRECKKQGRVTVATIADHIVALALGGSRSADNLQPLCKPCHDKKTLSESRRTKQRAS